MIHKANVIAQFFEAYTREEAIEGIRNHIQLYWVPRMRQQLHEYIEHGGEGLHSTVIEADKRIKQGVIR